MYTKKLQNKVEETENWEDFEAEGGWPDTGSCCAAYCVTSGSTSRTGTTTTVPGWLWCEKRIRKSYFPCINTAQETNYGGFTCWTWWATTKTTYCPSPYYTVPKTYAHAQLISCIDCSQHCTITTWYYCTGPTVGIASRCTVVATSPTTPTTHCSKPAPFTKNCT